MVLLPRAFRALALALALAGPGSAAVPSPRPGPPTLRPALLPTRFGDPATWSTFDQCLEYVERWVGRELPDWLVHSAIFSYPSRRPLYDGNGDPEKDAGGDQVCVPVVQSGRVFFPPYWRLRSGRDLPLVMYPHATMLQKTHVPSQYGGHEWMLGAAAALYYGYAVAMPDQPGMGGDGESYHTFCHAKSLAYSTVDALAPVARLTREDPYLARHGYGWDGRLFLVGYSEGAYTALATARELETHPGAPLGPFTLQGSACMAGPFDLSDSIRHEIIAKDRPFAHCFYLPYVVRSYSDIYGEVMAPAKVFAPALLDNREDGNILQWTDGCLDGLQVDDLIGRRLGVPGDRVVLRDILNPEWVAGQMDDPAFATSEVRKVLVENDLHGGWRPTRPILFCQSPDDREVPIKNTTRTMDELGAEIRKAGDDPATLLAFLPIGKTSDHIDHVAAALVAIPAAFNWIYSGMPME